MDPAYLTNINAWGSVRYVQPPGSMGILEALDEPILARIASAIGRTGGGLAVWGLRSNHRGRLAGSAWRSARPRWLVRRGPRAGRRKCAVCSSGAGLVDIPTRGPGAAQRGNYALRHALKPWSSVPPLAAADGPEGRPAAVALLFSFPLGGSGGKSRVVGCIPLEPRHVRPFTQKYRARPVRHL